MLARSSEPPETAEPDPRVWGWEFGPNEGRMVGHEVVGAESGSDLGPMASRSSASNLGGPPTG